MRKIVFLGDSLTADPKRLSEESWVKSLSNELKCKYENFAVVAGNNRLQTLFLQNYLLSDEYNPSDIFVWQLTAINRSNTLIKLDASIGHHDQRKTIDQILKNKEENTEHFYHVSLPNVFETDSRLAMLLCHEESIFTERHIFDPYNFQCLEEMVLQETVSYITSLSRMGHKVLCVLGWETCIKEDYIEKFLNILSKEKIHFIYDDILRWCKTQQLPFYDDLHPLQSSTLLWAKTHLMPHLTEIIKEEN